MASFDNLPPDQRAVLQMVLGRGRGYDQIAKMLQIDPGDVRQRAVAALDALGPSTRVPPERRVVITDYLLGQLPDGASEETRRQLANSPSERAWARVVASELQPLTERELPAIPAAAEGREAPAPGAPAAEPEAPVSAPAAAPGSEPPRARNRGPRAVAGPSSRRGGAILLGLGAAVVIAVVVVVVVTSGGSSPKSHPATSPTTASTAPAAASTTGCNPATSTTACPIAQINLHSPTNRSTIGIAEVLKKGSATAIAIVAQDVPPNTKHNAYVVWLANSSTDAKRLGFVNPGVGKNGRLQTAGPLPSNASHYSQLLVTLETHANPTKPGTIVLQGQFSEG
jgi:hypothetical protein